LKAEQETLEAVLTRSLEGVLTSVVVIPEPAGRIPERTAPLDIVIPIFNRADLLHQCLEALHPTLMDGDAIWLIDDASDETDVARVASDFARCWPTTQYIRNDENLGFVGSANKGIELTSRDLVLLNSDTEPCSGWLEHLQDCLGRNLTAGIVCPLSDEATILSVLPRGDFHKKSIIAERAGVTTVGDVKLPTAVGFCMLIKRACLQDIGQFSELFAPGYGEENDLSMRALRAGWDIVVADRACVFHHSAGSFGSEESRALKIRNERRLNRLWPEFYDLVGSWWKDNPLRIKTEQMSRQGNVRPDILHVLHRQYHVGGTERVTRSLITALHGRYHHTLIYPGITDNPLCDGEIRKSRIDRELMINAQWIKPTVTIAGHGADLTCAHSERAFARMLLGSGASVVHFHHLSHWDTLLLPALARKLGRKVVLSIHDFWFQCPVYNQLEYSTREPCGRFRAEADERCARCLLGYSDNTLRLGDGPASVSRFMSTRHALIRNALENADAIIIPSRFMKERMHGAFPTLDPEKLLLEPHGTRIPEKASGPSTGNRLVIAFFGGDQMMKGSEIVVALALSLRDAAVQFRIFGRIKGYAGRALPSTIELRGFYDPESVTDCLGGVDLALIPSFYEESFSMVASECWAHGVPVLASSRGALKHRVVEGVNGWLVPDMKPESWLRKLKSILEGSAIQTCRSRLAECEITSIEQWSTRIDQLYDRLLSISHDSSFGVVKANHETKFIKATKAFRRNVIDRAKNSKPNHYLGVMRDRWGTAYYRVRFPLEDLLRAEIGGSDFHIVREDGFRLEQSLAQSRAGHVLVQPFLSDEGLRMMEFMHREPGLEVVLVIDDLWTELHPDNPVRHLMPDNVKERLAYAVSLSQKVVLTTLELERRLGIEHPEIRVINNALPDWIWNFAPNRNYLSKDRSRFRIGWAGAPQHSADLRCLKKVVADTVDIADWVFLGACVPELEGLATEVHPMVPFDDYPAKLAALDVDLAVAPLVDTPFNRCKSHLKILEYGILGWPVVASDLEPYRDCPVIRMPPDDAVAWTACIRELLADPERRIEQGRALREWVLGGHMTRHRRGEWKQVLGA
jgi:GT2 family glycosyltransferase/glycosyltransferase involved in cell wall biosynthesis